MKRITSFILALVLTISAIPLFTTAASATSSKSETPKNGSYVRIRHAGSGRYLDVPAEGIDSCGTQLQVWEYAYGNQNQIFRMHKSNDGWQIISHMSGKCIEVRDSSNDDYAQVAQWDKHDLACARWDIINNSDGSVSFRNKESGKYLNVCGGGNAPNGTKIIQYHDDGTSAMRFYIEVMGNSDVLSAAFVRKIRNSDLSWTQYNPGTSYIFNTTDFSKYIDGKSYYPTVGQKIFVSAEYYSPNTVAKLVQEHSYSQSIWNQIKSALAGDLSEAGIARLLKDLEFGDVPGLGYALGILQILWNSQDEAEWNRFAQTVTYGCCGMIVYTYYTIGKVGSNGPLYNGTTAWGMRYYIKAYTNLEYARWTGDNFGEVNTLPVSNAVGWSYYKFK